MTRIIPLMLFVLLPTFASAGVDNSLYAKVLDRYVKDGLVNYAALKEHRTDLDTYLDMMATVEVGKLDRREQLAFYINLYNAATLQLVVNNYPVNSIKKIGSFFSTPWKLEIVRLEGKLVTLDHIEHDIVRPRFKEPRVHFALNCSAMSCPPLLSVPFEGDILDSQLEGATIRFINDGKNNYLDGKTLYVSKIFSWFSDDFPDDIVSWVTGYARGEMKRDVKQIQSDGGTVKVRFLSYDWSVNAQ